MKIKIAKRTGEIRQDPVSNCYTIFSEERSLRPFYYEFQNTAMESSMCPFCVGNECLTPPDILTVQDDSGTGWKIRVVPNKYPAVRASGNIIYSRGDLEYSVSSEGEHEVLIETPRHELSLTGLSETEISEVLEVYSCRLVSLSENTNSAYCSVFKNTGPIAGTSVVHTHTQILSLPVIPPVIANELFNCSIYYEKNERCLLCDILENEMENGYRVIAVNDSFAAFCPYASRFPYEVWIVPMKHSSHFERSHTGDYKDLAAVLKKVLLNLEKRIEDCSYNYFIHTMPFRSQASDSYHWHIEIVPRTSFFGGFEIETGMHINHVFPETAANELKSISLIRDKRRR